MYQQKLLIKVAASYGAKTVCVAITPHLPQPLPMLNGRSLIHTCGKGRCLQMMNIKRYLILCSRAINKNASFANGLDFYEVSFWSSYKLPLRRTLQLYCMFRQLNRLTNLPNTSRKYKARRELVIKEMSDAVCDATKDAKSFAAGHKKILLKTLDKMMPVRIKN